MNIQYILMNLDALDDDLWTADGAPKIAAIVSALGKAVTRQQIVDTAPGFTRGNMVIEGYDSGDSEDIVEPEPPIVTPTSLLQGERAELEANLATAIKKFEAMKSDIAKTTKRLDEVTTKLHVLDPPMSNQRRIRNYINASNESRLRRHATAARIVAALPASARTVGTPLDNAYARRNQRGLTRPTR